MNQPGEKIKIAIYFQNVVEANPKIKEYEFEISTKKGGYCVDTGDLVMNESGHGYIHSQVIDIEAYQMIMKKKM